MKYNERSKFWSYVVIATWPLQIWRVLRSRVLLSFHCPERKKLVSLPSPLPCPKENVKNRVQRIMTPTTNRNGFPTLRVKRSKWYQGTSRIHGQWFYSITHHLRCLIDHSYTLLAGPLGRGKSLSLRLRPTQTTHQRIPPKPVLRRRAKNRFLPESSQKLWPI